MAAGDVPAVKGYKCGWLNMVLFARLDLIRCEALVRVERATQHHEPCRSGAGLGAPGRRKWLDVRLLLPARVGAPAWLHEAFLGGTCSDPCGTYRDAVEALLAGYAPPVPQPGTSPEPPTVCPKGSILIGGKCIHIYFPPDDILVEWSDQWKIDPLGPIWYPPEIAEPSWTRPWEIYDTDPWNFLADGVIGGTDYIGQPGLEVKDVLDAYITEGGGVPDVRVLPHSDAQALEGYLPVGGLQPIGHDRPRDQRGR